MNTTVGADVYPVPPADTVILVTEELLNIYLNYIYMSSEDLKKIFDESIGSTKAYFISKVQQKYPRLDKKDIEKWFKSQEVVQINTTLKGFNLKITTKPRTF